MVEFLVGEGLNVNQLRDDGIIPISLTSNKEITKFLLKNGSFVNASGI
jgi:hypothetical protein